jgi:N-dimethylarginine dimethylaminohydrolase
LHNPHEVQLIEPVEGLPDMVFSANGATVVDGVVLLAKFRYRQRASEAAAYRQWFRTRGYRKIHEPQFINEGEGDYLVTSRHFWMALGSGPIGIRMARQKRFSVVPSLV